MKKFFVIWTVALIVVFLPDFASAQYGLVGCDGFNVECNFCTFASMIERVTNFIVSIMIILSVILLVVTGIQMAMTAGNSDAKQLLKGRLTNIVIGFVIVLGAWVFIDTMIKALVVDPQVIGWKTFLTSNSSELCGSVLKPVSVAITSDPDTGAPAGTTGGTATPTGDLVSYEGALFDAGVVDNIQYIDENFDLTVSGGHRTEERNDEVNGSPTSYHLSGRAGDFTGSQAAMEAGENWALANGASETLIHNAGSGTHLHVAW